jgi:hypothetical protein
MDASPFIRESLLLLQHRTCCPEDAVRLLGAIDRVILLGQPLDDDDDDLPTSRQEDPPHGHEVTPDPAPYCGTWSQLCLYSRILLQPMKPAPAPTEMLGELHASFYWKVFPCLSDVLLPGEGHRWRHHEEGGKEPYHACNTIFGPPTPLLAALDPAWLEDARCGPALTGLLRRLYASAPAPCALSALAG